MTIQFNFTDLAEGLKKKTEELSGWLGFEMCESGHPVSVSERESGIEVCYRKKGASIAYHKKSEYFRALSLLCEAAAKGEETRIEETPVFEDITYMQDNSRNAVSTMDSVRALIRKMALMGYTSLMLYTEDTYELPEYPYFGYFRGRFTKEELKELNDYGAEYGIELIPCIQTLAHLNQIFKYGCFNEIHDTADILLCGEEKTYELIDSMVRTCRECFTSEKINIGMDEAETMGLGKYLQKNGYQERFDIIVKHLDRVLAICRKYGFSAMMWSDMFFKLISGGGYYSDLTVSDHIKDMIPEDVTLIYWDYYTRDEKKYDLMFEGHKKLSENIVFAGGAWRWSGFAPLLRHSLYSSGMALKSAAAHGVTQVLVTGWGDNGAECSSQAVLPVLMQYAEFGYSGDISDEHLARRLAACAHADYQDFLQLDLPNLTPDNPAPGRVSVDPAKYLFFQDVLLGLYDRHVDPDTYPAHYQNCAELFGNIAAKGGEYGYIFETMEKLCAVLASKCDLGIRLKAAYDAGDKETLRRLADECAALAQRIDSFYEAFRTQWYKENRPFGFDVQDIRIGGLKQRVYAAERTICDYLEGRIERIAELEQERLVMDGRDNPGYRTLPLSRNNWSETVSACIV